MTNYLSVNDFIQLNNSMDYLMDRGTTETEHYQEYKAYYKHVYFKDDKNMFLHKDMVIDGSGKTAPFELNYWIKVNGFNYIYKIAGEIENKTDYIDLIDLIEKNHDSLNLSVIRYKKDFNKSREISAKCFINQLDKFCA